MAPQLRVKEEREIEREKVGKGRMDGSMNRSAMKTRTEGIVRLGVAFSSFTPSSHLRLIRAIYG